MERRPADTDEASLDVWLQVLRRLSPEQRLRNVVALFEQDLHLSRERLARLYPAASPPELELKLRRERWGDELFRQVYPDD